jgi:sRNA-binding protein
MARNENPRSRRVRGTTVAALLTRLFAEFPVLAGDRPLAIGIGLAMCDAAHDSSDQQRRRALTLHCGSQRYLEAVAAGGPRYALDGTVCGQVTKLQREAANARLETIAKATLRKAARAKLEAASLPGVALPTPRTKPGRRS